MSDGKYKGCMHCPRHLLRIRSDQNEVAAIARELNHKNARNPERLLTKLKDAKAQLAESKRLQE